MILLKYWQGAGSNMSTTVERDIVKELLKMCKGMDDLFEYRRVKWDGRNGAPDLLLGFPTLCRHYFVETKRPVGGKLSPHQEQEQMFLTEIGIEHRVISKLSEIVALQYELQGADCD